MAYASSTKLMGADELIPAFLGRFELGIHFGSPILLLAPRLTRVAVLRELDGLDVPWFAFKGDTLCTLVYPPGCIRRSGDLDILVPREALKRVLAKTGANFELQSNPRPTSMNQVLQIHTTLDVHLDLHWRIALPHLPAPTFEELWAERQSVNVGGLEINTFGPNLGALHLLIHAHQHLFEPRTLLDLALWLEKFDNRAEYLAAAERYGWSRAARIADALIEQIVSNSTGRHVSFEEELAEMILWEWTDGRKFQDLSTRSFVFQVLSVLLVEDKPLLRSLRYLAAGPHRVGTAIDRLRVALGRDPWEV